MRTEAVTSYEETFGTIRGLARQALYLAVEVIRAEERGEVSSATLDEAERAVACAELEFESIRLLVEDTPELSQDLAENLVRTDTELMRVHSELNESLARLHLVARERVTPVATPDKSGGVEVRVAKRP